MSQVVDRWATAILYPAVSYADHGPNTIGESAGAATRFEGIIFLQDRWTRPTATVTIVAMLNSLTTPYDLLRSPL